MIIFDARCVRYRQYNMSYIIIIILLTIMNGGEYIKLGNIIILCSDYNIE